MTVRLDKLTPFRYLNGTGGDVVHVAVGNDDRSGERIHQRVNFGRVFKTGTCLVRTGDKAKGDYFHPIVQFR